jgi:disulfide oxidoreductase YuzD
MSAENPKYWAIENDERFGCSTIEERIIQLRQERFGDIPETLELIGYDPMTINEEAQKRFADWILESLLENMDESEFGGEDYTDVNQTMKDAASEFIKKIVAEYRVWPCLEVCRKTVNTADYIKPEEPDA